MEHGAAWVIRNSEGMILVELTKSFAADYALQTEFRACFEALDWCFSQQLSPSQTSYRFLIPWFWFSRDTTRDKKNDMEGVFLSET